MALWMPWVPVVREEMHLIDRILSRRKIVCAVGERLAFEVQHRVVDGARNFEAGGQCVVLRGAQLRIDALQRKQVLLGCSAVYDIGHSSFLLGVLNGPLRGPRPHDASVVPSGGIPEAAQIPAKIARRDLARSAGGKCLPQVAEPTSRGNFCRQRFGPAPAPSREAKFAPQGAAQFADTTPEDRPDFRQILSISISWPCTTQTWHDAWLWTRQDKDLQ